MRIPDVEGLKGAHEALDASNVTVSAHHLNNGTNNDTDKSAGALGQPKSFGRAAAVLSAANDTARSTSMAQKDSAYTGQLNERQSSCPRGTAFYKCRNGFTGCCSVDPCDPGGSCPDGKEKGGEDKTTTRESESGRVTATGVSSPRSTRTSTEEGKTTLIRTATTSAPATATGIRTASPTGPGASTTSRRVPRPTASPAPNCPRANGKTYNDSFKIPYRIRCNSDNTFDSFDSIAVGTGGYDQCFSSCSQSDECAGFTYVGLDSGDCYLKAEMPNGTYVGKEGKNYISCAKVNPEQSAGTDPSDVKLTPKRQTGAIVGGVVGGVAFLGLLLLLVAFLAKRHRKKIDRKRQASVTHVLHGPIETDMRAPPLPQQQTQGPAYGYAPGYGQPQATAYGQSGYQHVRQGSTSHDVFTPYGDFYRGTANLAADRLVTNRGRLEGFNMAGPPGEATVVATLPTSVYRGSVGVNRSADHVAMLDGTPITPSAVIPSRASGGSRSPRFREHLAEVEDTSPSSYRHRTSSPPMGPAISRISSPTADSPTLGRQASYPQPSLADDLRRKQHLMMWNNYDAGHASRDAVELEQMEATMAPKSPPAERRVSPDTEPGRSDENYVVSPFGSLERGLK